MLWENYELLASGCVDGCYFYSQENRLIDVASFQLCYNPNKHTSDWDSILGLHPVSWAVTVIGPWLEWIFVVSSHGLLHLLAADLWFAVGNHECVYCTWDNFWKFDWIMRKPVNNSVNSAEFRVSKILWFLVWLNFVSAEFSLFSPIF
jgi:hypothetical protein